MSTKKVSIIVNKIYDKIIVKYNNLSYKKYTWEEFHSCQCAYVYFYKKSSVEKTYENDMLRRIDALVDRYLGGIRIITEYYKNGNIFSNNYNIGYESGGMVSYYYETGSIRKFYYYIDSVEVGFVDSYDVYGNSIRPDFYTTKNGAVYSINGVLIYNKK